MHEQTKTNVQKTSDGSVVDVDGKVIYFSVDRFIKDICEGDCCFICGAAPETTDFNNEHIPVVVKKVVASSYATLSSSSAGFDGFNQTSCGASQFRVGPLQRCGCFAFAASYTATRLARRAASAPAWR